jgi:hypothetical protein
VFLNSNAPACELIAARTDNASSFLYIVLSLCDFKLYV